MKEQIKGLLLEELYELCYRAHLNTSFSPEKRAISYVVCYSEQLAEDLEKLGENAGNYKQKFIERFSDWMSAKGRCISSMITGPSNFPTRKAEKYNNWEMAKYDAFVKWREKYFNAVNRKPTPSPEQELDDAMHRLDLLVIKQENMKAINKIVKKATKENITIAELKDRLKAEEFPEAMIEEAVNSRGWWGLGFAPFQLTNNNATIKRTKEKVLIMKNRIATKENFEDINFEGGYITIEDDRVKIYHDEKPEREIIQEIKSNGFRWSPHWGCWCRKHTRNGLLTAKSLSFVTA